jgi:hypothetical protein
MRILLIAPAFYDYHHHIVREFERRGHEVRFFAERPDRWLYSPAKKLPARWRRAVFDRYLRGVLQQVEGEVFDRVLLIRGEIVAPWFVQALRARQPQARFVMYQWDSYRVTDFRPLVPLFDAVSTFDSVDAKELGLGYLPLFHIPSYRLQDAPERPDWDLVFVGSFHDARYRALLDIREHCRQRGIRLCHYLYLAPFDYLKLRLMSRQPPAREDVEFRKLDQATVVALYRNASGILDIENNKQTGLTMRSFEALATGRLLLTTNPLAAELLPELAGRILTIDRQHLDLPTELLRKAPGWDDGLMAWSIESWTSKLLDM